MQFFCQNVVYNIKNDNWRHILYYFYQLLELEKPFLLSLFIKNIKLFKNQ